MSEIKNNDGKNKLKIMIVKTIELHKTNRVKSLTLVHHNYTWLEIINEHKPINEKWN